MFAKLRKFGKLGVVCGALLVVMVGQASASSTLTVSPSGAKTLSSAGSGAFIHVGSFIWTAGTSCTMTGTWSSTSGTLPLAFSGPIAIASPIDSTQGNLRFMCAGCSNMGVSCTFICDGRANLVALSLTAAGRTPVRLTGFTCTVRFAAPACSATIAGSGGTPGGFAGTYDNTSDTYQLDAPTGTNQNLVTSGSTCGSFLPNGIGTMSGVSNSAVVFRVSPTTTVTVV